MSELDSRPGVAERYATASVGGENVLGAAAWAGEEAGRILSRAQNEFDDAHATIPADAGAVARRVMTMARVSSLSEASAVVFGFAVERATRLGWRHEDIEGQEDELLKCARQALSVFLDPRCAACGGVGCSGGYDGRRRVRCGHCHETGLRRGFVGNTDRQRHFIEALLCRIESAVSDFTTATRRGLQG